MTKFKRALVFFCLLTLVVGVFSLASCQKDQTVESLTSQSGIVLSGSGLQKDVEFVVEKITDEARKEELQTPLSTLTYDKSAGVVIYKLDLTKNGEHFHIESPLTVTMNAPLSDVTEYAVFHIKENNSIESYFPIKQSDGTISFEIRSMGYLIIGKAMPASQVSHRLSLFSVVESDGAVSVLKNGQKTVFSSDALQDPTQKDAYSMVLLQGQTATLSTACENENAKFVGWFRVVSEDKEASATDRLSRLKLEETPISTKTEVTFSYDSLIKSGGQSTYCAVWMAKRTFVVDMDTLLPKNDEGKYVYYTSDPRPDLDKLVAQSSNLLTMEGSFLTAGNGYTIEKNRLDLTSAGEYTVTYVCDADPSLTATFKIVVVESPILTVNAGKGGAVIYQNQIREEAFVDILKHGTKVVLTAYPSENYRFLGWYQNGTLLSTSLNLSLTVTGSCAITPKFEEWSLHKLEFGIQSESNTSATISKNGVVVLNTSSTEPFSVMLRKGENVTLTAETSQQPLVFVGWYMKNNGGSSSILVSRDATYTFEASDSNASYFAVFQAVNEMRVEIVPEDVHMTYSEATGRYTYQIGDTAPAFESVKVAKYNLLTGESLALTANVGFLVDTGDFKVDVAGVYTISYICIDDPSAIYTIEVEVIAK